MFSPLFGPTLSTAHRQGGNRLTHLGAVTGHHGRHTPEPPAYRLTILRWPAGRVNDHRGVHPNCNQFATNRSLIGHLETAPRASSWKFGEIPTSAMK
jgi:hypothetical protein